MRKIKFRVWDKDNRKMMVGNNQYGADEPDFNREKSSAGAFTRLWEALARITENERYVLMQYTGIEDITGKEIYEGDIVYSDVYNKCSEVFYDDGCFCVKFLETITDLLCEVDCEVIGNIYENPELLKQD